MSGAGGRIPNVAEDEELLVIARWGARPATAEAVTEAVIRFARAVRETTGFGAEPLEPAAVDLDDSGAVAEWVRSTAYRDETGRTFPDDGFSPDLTFDGADGQVVAGIAAGRAVSGSRIAANRLDLTLRGSAKPLADRLVDLTDAVWDPDFVSIVDIDVMTGIRVPGRSVRLGYRTVVASRLVRALTAPAGYSLDRSGDRYDLRLTGPWAADRVTAAAAELASLADLEQLAQRVAD
jgi:hypothetical protein